MIDYGAMNQAVQAAQTKRRGNDFPALEEGYTFKAEGRSGFVYYREGDHVLEIYWEMSGVPQYDILIAPLEITKWTSPGDQTIPPEKRQQIVDGLRTYLLARKIRPDI
jgi:hypothetical protein